MGLYNLRKHSSTMANKQLTEKQISAALKEEITRFFRTHKAGVFSKHLRCMLLDYLAQELRIGVPLYLDELLWQLYELFELLDMAEQETRDWHVTKKATTTKKGKRAKL